MSGGRFEAALEFLPKQQQQQPQQQHQNEPVNGMSKGASSGKLVNLLLLDPVCKMSNSMEQNPPKEANIFSLTEEIACLNGTECSLLC